MLFFLAVSLNIYILLIRISSCEVLPSQHHQKQPFLYITIMKSIIAEKIKLTAIFQTLCFSTVAAAEGEIWDCCCFFLFQLGPIFLNHKLCCHDLNVVPWGNIHIITAAKELSGYSSDVPSGLSQSLGCHFYYTMKSELWVQRLTMATTREAELLEKKFAHQLMQEFLTD